jgi:hypothetical protein
MACRAPANVALQQGDVRRQSRLHVTPAFRFGAGLAILATAACPFSPIHAQSSGLNGVVALSSQLIDRGVAIAPATPTLQGAVSWVSASGWSLGLSGSSEVRSPGHIVEAVAQASRSWSLSDDWQMQANLLYYKARMSTYDRTELGVGWIYRDVLTFNLSAARVLHNSHQSPRAAADLSLHWPLAWHFSFSAGVGVAQSLVADANSQGHVRGAPYGYHPMNHYAYGHAGLLWEHGPWQMELDRITTDPDLRRQRGNLSASPWVAAISRSF